MAADQHAVTELVLFINNDGALYRQRYEPIVKNLARKMRKGQYDYNRALKMVKYLVDEAAKKYAKEYATPSQWNTIFNVDTRKLAAKELLTGYIEDAAWYSAGGRAGVAPGNKFAAKRNPGCKTRRNMANAMVPHGKKNPSTRKKGPTMRRSKTKMNPFAKGKRLTGDEIPKGKRKGEMFTKGGRTYVVISYTTKNGKRVRYAAPVKGVKKSTRKRKIAKTSKTVEVPKGKRKGDKFTRGGAKYTVVSYTTPSGKRVRYGKRV